MNSQWRKDTILFIASQTISLFGSSLVMYAIMWYITLETQSGVMMMFSIIFGVLPQFFLAPFAGVWADRYDRKKLIILSDAFIAIATLLIAIIFIMGYTSIVLLFIASTFRAVGGAVQYPAVSAFIPQIVPEEKLTKVQGMNGSIQSAVMLISPMASGALLAFARLETIFFIDVITAMIAITILYRWLKVKPHEKALAPSEQSYLKDLKDGAHYILNKGYLKKFFIFIAIFSFLVTPVAMLSPLQVSRSFGNDVWRLTAVEIVFSGGAILGGLIIARWGGFRNKVTTMTFACFVIGLCTLVLGIVPIFWLYLFFMGLIGLCVPLFNTPSIVLLQENVESDYMGRVFGVWTMIGSAMMPLGMIVFGPIADVIRIEWLLVVTGIMMFIQALFLLGTAELVAVGKEREVSPIDNKSN